MPSLWQAQTLVQKMANESNTLPILSYYHSEGKTENKYFTVHQKQMLSQ